MIDLASFYSGKRVLVTGHTGFKGSWLALWLAEMGAEVHGYALPPADPSLFRELGLERRLAGHHLGDVREFEQLRTAIVRTKPEIIFHLAAQPLVRQSYREPRLTFETNVMGVVNLLDAVRLDGGPRVVQVITTDKCYENSGRGLAFREDDPLGGSDPYSGSKACAELAVAAYRPSFFADGPSLATVRAGNVIGGGDWAEDRIIPDCIRAFQTNQPVAVRNPQATRPWQHVLEPLAGYLALAERQWHDRQRYNGAWNFGPFPDAHLSVQRLVDLAREIWGDGASHVHGSPADTGRATFHEAPTLMLDVSKAVTQLGWHPVFNVRRAVTETVRWYRQRWQAGPRVDAEQICREQIQLYQKVAAEMNVV
jgi:CDP-glucose 4,6-dehydratase